MQTVYLTRRNLLALLDKLDNPNSYKTLIKYDTEHPKYACSDIIRVVALENEDYYTDREPGPVLHSSGEVY